MKISRAHATVAAGVIALGLGLFVVPLARAQGTTPPGSASAACGTEVIYNPNVVKGQKGIFEGPAQITAIAASGDPKASALVPDGFIFGVMQGAQFAGSDWARAGQIHGALFLAKGQAISIAHVSAAPALLISRCK